MIKIKQILNRWLPSRRRRVVQPQQQPKERIVENNNQQHQPILYTEEQLMARLKFFIGILVYHAIGEKSPCNSNLKFVGFPKFPIGF